MKPPNLYSLEDAFKLSREEIAELYGRHINPGLLQMLRLVGFDRKYVRAEGMYVWDDSGQRYLDLLGAYGALNFGHNPPAVLQALEKVRHMPNLLQASVGTMAALLAANLARLTPGNLSRCFFGNSGAEAVEGALKLARLATGRSTFVYAENSFHGKTFGALSVTGRKKYQEPFRPLLPYAFAVPYGDLSALEARLKAEDVAAVILEPIQGEGGVIVPPPGYLSGVRELCTRYGTLLILDEIQTGMGRTGYNFACEKEAVVPDILCLGKSLGGGVMPIAAYIATEKVWDRAYGKLERATLHTSTFGGNTLAAAAGIASLNFLVEQNLAVEARRKGEYFIARLQELAARYPLLREVRGEGLLIGLEFHAPEGGVLNRFTGGAAAEWGREFVGAVVAGELLNRHQIITAYTLNNPNVIRLEPPLIISEAEIDYVVKALQETLENRSLASLAWQGAKTALKSFLGR